MEVETSRSVCLREHRCELKQVICNILLVKEQITIDLASALDNFRSNISDSSDLNKKNLNVGQIFFFSVILIDIGFLQKECFFRTNLKQK